MAASVQFRPQNRDLGMVMREVDEDLAIFLGMRNSEKEKNGHFLEESDEFDDSKGVEEKPDSLMSLNPSEAEIVPADEKLLDLENEESDYNWLLMQPDSSSLPLVDVEVKDSAAHQTEISNDRRISSKDEVENSFKESVSINDNSSNSADSSAASNRRPLSAENRKPAPKAAKSKPSRACMPTSRSMLPSSKTMAAQGRSSTTSGVPTPPSRPSVPVISKSSSRSSTPTRKSATPTTILKSAPSLGTSPSVKSRQSKPSEILSSSHDATQNPRISMPKRAASASRTRSSSYNGKPGQKSCSPTKVRAPMSTGNKTGSKILTRSRGYGSHGDGVNPVIVGTKMVDRVVNMRKLAPPKRDECVTHDNQRKCSQENSGFGRSLSKKSLDMALRHMDITLSIPEKLRPVAKSVSAKSNAVGISETCPTSSCDSSKSSRSITYNNSHR